MSKILVVDENDQPIGAASKEEIWQKGLHHRIVRILIEDEQGRVLLQKRSMRMGTFPGCWDLAAAGHVDAGEDYDEAAKRELQEELGLSNVALRKVAAYPTTGVFEGRKLNRLNALYRATVSSLQPIQLQESEVSEVRWFTPEAVRRLIAEQPEKVTDGLAQVVGDYF